MATNVLIVLLLLPGCGGIADGSDARTPLPAAPDTTALYGVWELTVENPGAYENPYDFREIELTAVFTSPSGEETSFFGFHDGDGTGGAEGDVWRLRFMPDEPGRWTYRYDWSDGAPGGEGTFVVTEAGPPGPLAVDADAPWFFETARGEPFHFRGYDLHVMAPYLPSGSLEEETGRISEILASLAAQGVNFTMLDGAIGRRTSDPNTWEESWWRDGDPRRFDPATWSAFEEILRAAARQGIYVTTFAGMIYQGEGYSFEDFQLFLRYWTARLAPFYNFLGYSPTWEWTDVWRPEEVDRIMGYLAEINPFPVLLSAHDCSHSSFDDWLGFSMRQAQSRTVSDSRRSGQSQGACGAAGGVARPFVDRPILGSEDVWETESGRFGHPRNAREVRRAAWGEMLAGVMPLYSEWHPNPPPEGGRGTGWPEVRRMFDFWYAETRYRRYRPLDSVLPEGDSAAAAGIPGEEYLVYDQGGGTLALDPGPASGGVSFRVLWFDPATGERLESETVTFGEGERLLASPFRGDAVLLLRAR